ncbi:oxidoreductase [Photobacterium sp. OFAV2-7]|uniref:oxidoreductase n=1 Tax=Photobacterium sp. OFAV2-7 TaxID=2917748 RepID=UPI001EF53E41|nr:oxidoreductase [Photobacterium sp. OFAV2-7]
MTKCWSTSDISKLSDKLAIVTGGNTGLGFQSALELARAGCHVIITGRDERKGQDAVRKLIEQVPDAQLEFAILDLTNPDSIDQFACDYINQYHRLDILLNNAGVVNLEQLQRTPAGYEMHFATNHLGHFSLTGRLLPAIKNTPKARVVTVSSGGHKFGEINVEDIHWQTRQYNRVKAYGDSKLANLLFSQQLQRYFSKYSIDAFSLSAHPGLTGTERQQSIGVGGIVSKYLASSVETGVLPQLRACCDDECRGGDYLGPRFGIRGAPVKANPDPRVSSIELAEKLWELSSDLTGIQYNFD